MKIIEKPLTELFSTVRGNPDYTKAYGNKNRGKYPVYSASNTDPLTSINHYDYDGIFMTWSTNGFGGFIRILDGQFSINADRGILIPKEPKKINIEYFRYVLQPILRNLARGRKGEGGKNEFTKVPVGMVQSVNVPVPVDDNGELDISKQEELANKFSLVEDIKRNLESEFESLEKIQVYEYSKNKMKKILLGDETLFMVDNGERIRKKDIDKARGNIPVYSASFKDGTLGYCSEQITKIVPKAKKFTGRCITVNADGSDYSAFLRNETFYANDVLNVIKIIHPKIHPEYILYTLRILLYSMMLSYSNKLYKDKLRQLEIEIPIKENGEFDEKEQCRIADKYALVENTRKILKEELQQVTTSLVSV